MKAFSRRTSDGGNNPLRRISNGVLKGALSRQRLLYELLEGISNGVLKDGVADGEDGSDDEVGISNGVLKDLIILRDLAHRVWSHLQWSIER